MEITQLIKEKLDKARENGALPLIVSVDGHAAAGKTTLAEKLHEAEILISQEILNLWKLVVIVFFVKFVFLF